MVMLDAGYDVTRLAFVLADLPVHLVGRIRADRVLLAATPPRPVDGPGPTGPPPRPGAGRGAWARPRRHGGGDGPGRSGQLAGPDHADVRGHRPLRHGPSH